MSGFAPAIQEKKAERGKPPTLAVNEIFGPTIQGEGKSAGMPCHFLRLAGCNLACVFCDTPYTWKWGTGPGEFDPKKEIHPMVVDEVFDRLEEMADATGVRSLVISGGEPMLQQRALVHLTRRLHEKKWHTEIETAGTIKPHTIELVKHWTCSPKLSNSGNPLDKRYKPDALEVIGFALSRCFKFVVTAPADFDEIDALVKAHSLGPVYIMPEGIDSDTLDGRLGWIAEEAIKRNYWVSGRMHVQLYGNKRGV